MQKFENNGDKLSTNYNKILAYYSFTQMIMLLVQPVVDVDTASFFFLKLFLPQISLQAYAPLVNCTVNDTLFYAVLNVQQTVH